MISTLKRITACLALASGFVFAGPVLIVNGSIGTSEADTTASITTNLQNLHVLAGNTVTVTSDIPVDLSPFTQVWDIRFSDNFGLTAAQQAQYLSFLQGGGGMFLMGENDGFLNRDGSIFDFISLAGGGVVGPDLVGGCDGEQNVLGAFQGPNPVTTINFECSGVVGSKGTGEWIAQRADGSGGSGIAFSVGDLANAPSAALTVILDVNFMALDNTEPRLNLTKNLIGFVGDQVDPPVPVPAAPVLILLGLAIGALRYRVR
jgi:hypothetical protein